MARNIALSGKRLVLHASDDENEDTHIGSSDGIEKLLPLEKLKITESKKLLVLDLNGLLVHTFFQDVTVNIPRSRRPDGVVGRKLVFKRPFCDEFVRFCFQRFDVGIWSSARKSNVEGVITCVFQALRSRILFIWDQNDCTDTRLKTLENRNKPLFVKELKKIWDSKFSGLPWSKGRFSSSNVLLIDDSPYKALLNPPNTAIFPTPYTLDQVRDDSLGPKGEMRVFLEGLAEAEDVPTYVASHHFGQPAITSEDPNWNFYSKIIRTFNHG
ncbi:hypothetical protein QJS10_CPA08g00538 [Acorus calamus]|uniref:Mitochondrial import inner membrane translocase subunit TIM50 n=1 Tax=Acorus calamus TaxID=4465 RepID=A0AAV9EA74_ACOCL|nr:hypothetical protein QJS10_CPA08g00538 [Acorus calamus]